MVCLPGRSGGGLRLILCLLSAMTCVAGPALSADKSGAMPLMSTPQVVRDLHYGDVLFHFYQDDYFQSLIRLDAAQSQQRIPNHGVEAELLKGGLYLSLGQHAEAGRIFQALLNDNVSDDVRNRAWFYLARVWYQRNYLAEAEKALGSIRGALPGDLEAERHLLLAQVLMYQDRYDDAIRVLGSLQLQDAWAAYARFNLGVALVRQQRLDDAARLLDEVGQMPAPTEELAALRDKANLALGYAWLKADRAADGKRVLQRVRLQGPQSNKALLGAGWADSASADFRKALVPWLELRERDLLDAAVQEAYLAIPYAYAQLAANRQAAEQYTLAIRSFKEESQRIDQSIEAIRSGRLLESVLENDESDKTGWYWQLHSIPDAPETRYLYHLLASNEFQEGLKNYRDLKLMQRNLAGWSLSVESFRDFIDTQRLAHAQRSPRIEAVMTQVDIDALEARVLDAQTRMSVVEREADVVALATERERALWARIQKIDQALQRVDPNDSDFAEMREKSRMLRGTLLWDLSASYKARLWRERKELRELEVASKEARRRWTLVERARIDSPGRTEQAATRVAALEPRLASLVARLDQSASAQNQYLAAIAIRELEAQKQRLASYSRQAQFALASIYDRTAADAEGGRP